MLDDHGVGDIVLLALGMDVSQAIIGDRQDRGDMFVVGGGIHGSVKGSKFDERKDVPDSTALGIIHTLQHPRVLNNW